jgi:hypothetical protein
MAYDAERRTLSIETTQACSRPRAGIAAAFGLDGSGDSLAEPTLLLVHQLEARELP